MRQITSERRYTIFILLKQGDTPDEIGKLIGKDRSSIYREINRNKDGRNGKYKAPLSEKKTRKRHKSKSNA